MATPGYNTDLINIDLADALGTWVEPGTWTLGGVPVADTENYIQGSSAASGSISKTFNAAGVGGMVMNYGSGVTFGTDEALFAWLYWASPKTLATEANGGMRIIIGDLSTAFNAWKVGGKDTYVYGGWINVVVDPAAVPTSGDYVVGSPTGTKQWFGAAYNNLDAISKGNPCLIDAFRKGRTLQCSGGEVGNYATFSGAAAVNDLTANRWGLLQAIPGGYLQKGLFLIGTSTASADFRDANTSIIVQDTKKVSSTFNKFEIRNAASRVDWVSIAFTALGTVSRGNFQVTDNADVNFTGDVFTDMGTFQFQSGSTINNSTFRRCDTITQSGATFAGCTIDSSRATRSILSDNPGLISNSSFTSDGSNHAIEISTLGASAAYILTGLTYTGYVTAGSGTSGNECIYNNSGQHVKLTIDGGAEPSYRNGTSATTQIVTGQRTLTLTGLVSGSEVRIYDQAGPPPNELAGIESSGTTFQYSYTYSASTYVDIVVHKEDKIYYRVEDYLLLDANSSLPISQQLDRQYNNP